MLSRDMFLLCWLCSEAFDSTVIFAAYRYICSTNNLDVLLCLGRTSIYKMHLAKGDRKYLP